MNKYNKMTGWEKIFTTSKSSKEYVKIPKKKNTRT
jgi:hypothetical protein